MMGRKKSDNRVGAQSTASNGMQMTCIAYRGYHDIDVQFEDGCIVEHKNWRNFLNGHIHYPYAGRNKVGVQSMATNGMQMTCVAYRHSRDIDVQFEDGVIVEHRSWGAFLKGYIRHPHVKVKKV